MSDHDLLDAFEGALLGACIGDALGAPTELLSHGTIRRLWGGEVRTFAAPDRSPFAAGRRAGQITDDATQTLYLAEAIVAANGVVTSQVAGQSLVRWADEQPELFDRFAGPSTRAGITHLREGGDPASPPPPVHHSGQGATNGLAMRSAPIGLLHAGAPDAVVDTVIACALPTHPTTVAVAGAAAVAAAVAEATTPGATPLSTVRTARRVAETTLAISDPRLQTVAAPSVIARIDDAVSLAATAPDVETASVRLADHIGAGLHTCEAVPAALGLVIAADGDPMDVLAAAASIGDDTDTVACMDGAIVGALRGASALPPQLITGVLDANPIAPQQLAQQLHDVHQHLTRHETAR